MKIKKKILLSALMMCAGAFASNNFISTVDAAPQPATFSVEQADDFLDKHKSDVKTRWYPKYHVAAPCGWVNDPNGFSFFDGKYHLFYQHYPYEPKWGPMHWGHAVSDDLAHWTHLPVALAPDQPYDIGDTGGCFSGGAIEKDGKLYLIYTGHIESKDGRNKTEVQNVAVGADGVHFVKSSKNPVLKVPQRKDISAVDFRDPKVWEHDGKYYMALGSKTNDDPSLGQVLLFQSNDLESWEFKNVMARSQNDEGFMWECPAFATLDGRDALIISPIVKRNGKEIHQVVGAIGNLNYETGEFAHEEFQTIDHGFDFYAPQMMNAPDGRCLMIGWLDNWDNEMPEKIDGWAGMMTVPRELKLQDGKILCKPVEELQNLRQSGVTYRDALIDKEKKFERISGAVGELVLDVDAAQSSSFKIKLRSSKDEETVLSYDKSTRIFKIDRDKSSKKGPGGSREVQLLPSDRLKIQVFLDRSSIEVFLNDGEAVMSARIYPKPSSTDIVFIPERTLKINEISFYTFD